MKTLPPKIEYMLEKEKAEVDAYLARKKKETEFLNRVADTVQVADNVSWRVRREPEFYGQSRDDIPIIINAPGRRIAIFKHKDGVSISVKKGGFYDPDPIKTWPLSLDLSESEIWAAVERAMTFKFGFWFKLFG